MKLRTKNFFYFYMTTLVVFFISSFIDARPIASSLRLSSYDIEQLESNVHEQYVYLGSELSNIIDVIEQVVVLVNPKDQNSIVCAFADYVHKDHNIARFEDALQVLEQATVIFENNVNRMSNNAIA